MTPLCRINDIPEGSAKGFEVGNTNLLAIKKSGELFIYRNQCPHLGVELNWLEDQFLDISGLMIQCATHGALFLIEDGNCVAGPCQGQALQPVVFEIIDSQVFLTASSEKLKIRES